MKVYLNGDMVDADKAQVSVHDAGLQHGVGLFETMAAQHGRAFRLDQHLERLAQSATTLGLARELDRAELTGAVERTLTENDLAEARVRLTLTAGAASTLPRPGGAPPEVAEPTVLVIATPPVAYAPAYFEDGVRVLIAPPGANPFDATSGHKTLAYWGRLRTLRQAAAAGAGEAIWLNVTNHLASGAVSNVFLVKDGVLLTPIARGEEEQGGLPAPVLPGVTRAAVMELAPGLGLAVEKRMLTIDDLLEADEVFLTNSGWQVLPVSSVEKQAISDGRAGEVTRRVREAVMGLIEKETGI